MFVRVCDLDSYSHHAIVDHDKIGSLLLPRDVISILIAGHPRPGEAKSRVGLVNDRCDKPNLGGEKRDPQ
jgi:hypothetical protein